tara:strand:+ start:391 stop:1158 length:768 start_codon:yes stop_codon:yes gene_type:complete
LKLSTDHYIYTGTVRHRRYIPFESEFSYPVFMLYLDINDLENVINKSIFWNINKPAIVSFNRRDFHGKKDVDLDTAVRNTIENRVGNRPEGKIRMLAHLRYFGYCFNPVTFYYCFNCNDDRVDYILAEVTNTPWKERHAYVLSSSKESDKSEIRLSMKKELHVSPFWDMDHMYDWVFSSPQDKLNVFMKNFKDGNHVFDAKLSMDRTEMTKRNLLKSVFRFPFMTIKVVFWIHFQAFILWLRGATFYTHPSKIKN